MDNIVAAKMLVERKTARNPPALAVGSVNTGICRKIDDLGRVAIPKQIRRNLNITEGEELEIWVENGNTICLKPVCRKDDDFVSWEWLKQYAKGKRFNFASDFVMEAENKYRKNSNV